MGNFATVQEVQEALDNASFPLVFDQRGKSSSSRCRHRSGGLMEGTPNCKEQNPEI